MLAVAELPPGLGESVAVKTEPVTLSMVAVTGPAGAPDELGNTTVAVTVAVLPYGTFDDGEIVAVSVALTIVTVIETGVRLVLAE